MHGWEGELALDVPGRRWRRGLERSTEKARATLHSHDRQRGIGRECGGTYKAKATLRPTATVEGWRGTYSVTSGQHRG